MIYLKGFSESSAKFDVVKLDLQDIFGEILFSDEWYLIIDKNWGGSGAEYSVSISFGDKTPYYRDWEENPLYGLKKLGEVVIEAISRSIEYMSGYDYKIERITEHDEDNANWDFEYVDIVESDDTFLIDENTYLLENEIIRITFTQHR